MLWFYKDYLAKKDKNYYVADFIESEAPTKYKILHEWAQSTIEAQHFIERLTPPNAIILDPFMVSGTTGIAALKLDREFIGIEIDSERFEVARLNLAKNSPSQSF